MQMQRRISFSPRPPPPPPFPVTLPQLDYTKLPEFPSVSTIKGRAGGGVSGKVVRELLSLSLCVSVCLSLSLPLRTLISKEAQRRFASFDTRQIYLYSSRALCAKASDPGPLEYVYAGNVERGNGRFQVTRKRLTKIFKRDAGRAARGCLLSLHHAIMENESQTSPRSSISWKIAPILLLPFPPRFFFEITPRF